MLELGFFCWSFVLISMPAIELCKQYEMLYWSIWIQFYTEIAWILYSPTASCRALWMDRNEEPKLRLLVASVGWPQELLCFFHTLLPCSTIPKIDILRMVGSLVSLFPEYRFKATRIFCMHTHIIRNGILHTAIFPIVQYSLTICII